MKAFVEIRYLFGHTSICAKFTCKTKAERQWRRMLDDRDDPTDMYRWVEIYEWLADNQTGEITPVMSIPLTKEFDAIRVSAIEKYKQNKQNKHGQL